MFDYPPYPYLFQVAEHCPKSVVSYMNLWKSRNKDNRVFVFKSDIRSDYLTTHTKFKNDLLMLAKEGLVSVDESPSKYTVELVGYDNNFDKFGDQLEV